MKKKPKKQGPARPSHTTVKAAAGVVGRTLELDQIEACLRAGRNVLLEGPVGVGKTHVALQVAIASRRSVFRVDGDSRYTEQKLSGWFDPPAVMKAGYSSKSFAPGPLVEAMQSGGILFINELNRMPEGVQNVLLPAIDEGLLVVPRLGEIRAREGFQVIATQNPKEFVATSHLSEAILDRFELIRLDYQTEEEEIQIVLGQLIDWQKKVPPSDLDWVGRTAVRITRLTRDWEKIRRGASVRAAIAMSQIALSLHATNPNRTLRDVLVLAACISLPTRIEWDSETLDGESLQALIEELALAAESGAKKKI